MGNRDWMRGIQEKMVSLQDHLNGRVPWYTENGR